jgi:hypothetical protein
LGEASVTESGLPPDVQNFLRQHVDSVEQLEILLLLARTSSRGWTVEEIVTELRVNAGSVQKRLTDMERRGLVAKDGNLYRFLDQSPYAPVVRQVGDTYRERRVAVIGFIFSKPSNSIQALADAFKVK